MRRTLNQFRVFLEKNPYTAAATVRLSGRARAAIFVYRLSIRILAQWARDKCPQQAAALAFQTALSLVPVTAIAFSILRGVGSLDAESRLLQFFSEHVFPRMSDVTERIQSFAGKVSIGALGRRRPHLHHRHLLLALQLRRADLQRHLAGRAAPHADRQVPDLLRHGHAAADAGRVLALLVGPAHRRRTDDALLRAVHDRARRLDPDEQAPAAHQRRLVGGDRPGRWRRRWLLEATKYLFVLFAERIMLKSYNSVYGPLGLVPLVLVWIYAAWVLSCSGAEITHALQNLRLLEAEDRRQRDDEPINGLVAAQMLAAVAATHEAGGAGHPKERLVAEFGLTPHNVERVVARLKARGLIAEVRGDLNGYVPGRRAPDHPARGGAGGLSLHRRRDRARQYLARAARSGDRARRGAQAPRIAGLTIADLMPAPAEAGAPLAIVPPARDGGD